MGGFSMTMKRNSIKMFLVMMVLTLVVSSLPLNAFAQEQISDDLSVYENELLIIETEEDIAALEELFADPEAIVQQTIQVAPSVGLDQSEVKPMVGGTAAVKAGIKSLLKNKTKVINAVKSLSPRAGKSLEVRWNKYIEPTLNKLLKYESLAWGTVEGHLASALMGTGIKNSSARSIAYWVVYVAQWIL